MKKTSIKTAFTAIFCIGPFLLMAQDSFSIKGRADGLKAGDKIYLIYPSKSEQVTDSAFVKNKRFTFKGKIQDPVQALLCLNQNPYVNKAANNGKLDVLNFYLESSSIKMNSKDTLKQIVVKGSKSNDDFMAMKSMLIPINEKFDALNKEAEKLGEEKLKDKTILAGFIARENQILKERNLVYLDFAEKNPKSYLSLIALNPAASNPENVKAAEQAYQKLSPELKNTDLGKSLPMVFNAGLYTNIGSMAADFTQNTPDGKPVKLADFKGKYVLLDFWASWCGPCRQENPNVVTSYNKFKEKNFTVLGVSLDMPGQKTSWLKAIENDQLPWTHVSDLKGWENIVAKQYGIRSIPANFLIDPTGKIIAKNLRGEELQAKLEELLSAK